MNQIDNGRMPWVPYYPAKLLGALAGMSSDQQLVYQVILLRIYETWGPCRDSVEVLARRMQMNRKRCADAIDALFETKKLHHEDGGIMNPFAASIMAEAEALHETRSGAGTKGANKRWGKTVKKQSKSDSQANGEVLANDSHKQEQLQEESPEEIPPSPPRRADDWPSDYQEQFWAMYPRKTEKKAALAKLDAVKKSGHVTWGVLTAGLNRYRQHISQQSVEERYIKHPATWLNRGCWDDVYKSGGLFDARSGTGGDPRSNSSGGGGGFSALAARRAREAGRHG